MKYILGKKLNMTQIFSPTGRLIPITRVQAGPCYVTQIKSSAKEGYQAIQLGFGETAATRISKPERGHLKKCSKNLNTLREFRIPKGIKEQAFQVGEKITVDMFIAGEKVKVTSVSKGKGFQGVVRRHGFHGHPTTHGHKDQTRMPGSIGAGGPQHVFKGRRMAGHMGHGQITVKNLKVVEVREGGILAIKGAIPGARHTVIQIVSA